MRSHEYDFSLAGLAGLVVPPLLPLGLFVLVMHLGAASDLLPTPYPILDTDRTILFHQAEASLQKHDASLLLIGDSSCLMDVSAPQLSRLLPGSPSLNLGTLSYLDLYAFGSVLEHYVRSNPNQLKNVILLMHADALRRVGSVDYHREALDHFYRGTDYCSPALPTLFCKFGVEIFRGRLLSRAVPQPLSGSYGHFYGFTSDLWNYLSAHKGSGIDPGRFDPTSPRAGGEYRLARTLEKASADFRAKIPEGVRLFVGITPIPESVIAPGFNQRRQEMLQTFGQWLKADAVLTELPTALGNDLFASSTHLNERGTSLYTEQLVRAISGYLRDQSR